MTERFAAAWLRLRESADRRARSRVLARAFLAALPARAHLIDLAAGGGANARYLAALAPQPADWTLVDSDAALMGQARVPARTVRRLTRDLSRQADDIGRLRPDGVTLASFLDLVSAVWATDFAATIARRKIPCLAATTVDGRLRWHPSDTADVAVQAAFHADQRRDKGFGPALGGDAADVFADAFRRQGYAVLRAPADWRLGRHDRVLLRAFVDGIAEAASRAGLAGAPAARVAGWHARRLAALTAGELAVTVGHEDVLAMPRRRNRCR